MDLGHKQTDAMLKDMEKRIQKVYAQAARETQAKTLQYFSSYADRYNKKVSELNAGKITKDEFQQWCRTNIMTGKRWQEMHDTIATDLANSDKLAISMINGYTPDVYALNHNYGTYECETGAMVDTSYTLYDRQTVERLIKDDPKLIPHPKLNENRDIRWNKQRFNNGIVQGILQGESIPDIAKRVALGTASSDYKAAVRNARTATTGAENAGRLDSYERAEEMGIKVKKVWMATLDSRTRDSHALLDGEEQKYDEPFSNKLMYPGDTESDADPSEIWNCRCTLIADINGNVDMSDLTWRNNKLDGMSYDEWKDAHREKEEQENSGDYSTIENAKTVDEISIYMDNQGWFDISDGIKTDLSGIDIEGARGIARGYQKVYDKYPQLKGKFIAPNTHPVKMKKSAYAQCSYYTGGVEFNKGSYKYYKAMSKKYLRDIADSKWNPEGTTADSIVIHELGHAIDGLLAKNNILGSLNTAGYIDSGAPRLRNEVMKTCNLKINNTNIINSVSEYATENSREWFAECFAEYMDSPNPRPVASEFGRRLDEFLSQVN